MSRKTAIWNVAVVGVLLAMAVLVASCKKQTPTQTPTPTPEAQTETQPAEPTPAPEAKPEPKPEAQPKPAPETKPDPQAQEKKEVEALNPEAVQAGYEPLPLVLPRPMFVGTPTNIQGVTNLRKPRGKARPPFYAPAGCKNLALGKPVSGSDEEPIMGELEMVTDGDKEAADGSYVELGPFLQHVTIDLGEEHEIYAIVLWHFHKQARVYFDVVVQVAKDENFIDAVTVFNNDIDNSAGLGVGKDMHYVETNEGLLIDAKGVKGRYVRCYSQGNSSNDLNHYIEVEVWGK